MQLSKKYRREKNIQVDLEIAHTFNDSLYWLSASHERWTAFLNTTYGVKGLFE